MKEILFSILFILIIGIGGLIYKNAAEHPSQPIACPMDAQVCPDGTSVARTGSSCTFAACLPPNVSIESANVAFSLPEGFESAEIPDGASVAAYENLEIASTTARIIIRRYLISASSTPLVTIQQTAISGTSGMPVAATSLTSSVINSRRFTVASIERFEGVVDTAYYLTRGADVLRFDAIDEGADWTNPKLEVSKLPAHSALLQLLATLQVIQ